MCVFLTGQNFLESVPVGRRHGNDVGRRVALHGAGPVAGTVDLEDRLASDRGRIQDDVRAEERKAPCGLREPLVPADADTHAACRGVKHLESGVSGRKIELLLIKMVIRNMGLPVNAEIFTGVQHDNRVVEGCHVPLIDADRQYDREFF